MMLADIIKAVRGFMVLISICTAAQLLNSQKLLNMQRLCDTCPFRVGERFGNIWGKIIADKLQPWLLLCWQDVFVLMSREASSGKIKQIVSLSLLKQFVKAICNSLLLHHTFSLLLLVLDLD